MRNGFFFEMTLLFAGFALVGCASAPETPDAPKEDKAAIERSRVYTDGVSMVLHPPTVACHVPAKSTKMVPPKAGETSTVWKDLVASASTCAFEKKWAELDQLSVIMTRMDLDSPWPAYFMSLSAEAKGEMARARWMVDLADRKSGSRIGVFAYERAHIYYSMKQTSQAMNEMNKALALDPSLVDGHLFLAQVHARDLEWDDAATSFAKALAIDGDSYRALSGLAEARIAQGKMDEAAALYTRANAQRPQELTPWVRLAFIYESQKNNEQALHTYQGLKSKLDRGDIKAKPDFDLNSKIKTLEAVTVRQPAQASTQNPGDKSTDTRSMK